jgi:hypothetical protein
MKKEKISIEQQLEGFIYIIRGQRVMLDEDLAHLYLVHTKALVQALKRNLTRFPADFMFQLTTEEHSVLRSQFVTSSGRTGRRYPPYVFTEQGVAMLSSILSSERAVQVNIEIMRAFVRLRQLVASHEELATHLSKLEAKYDHQFKIVFDALREIITPADPKPIRRIGFGRSKEDEHEY